MSTAGVGDGGPHEGFVHQCRNFDELGKHFRLFAVDWLGTGLSGRPPFVVSGRQQTEDFFHESLSVWREREVRGIAVRGWYP